MTDPSPVADRLYGINFRPQELALYGESVRFDLRYSPMCDDPAELLDRHWVVAVLEMTAEVPPDAELGREGGTLELLRCGWELECTTEAKIPAGSLAISLPMVRRLVDRMADTINELAARAGLEAPMGTDVIDRLLASMPNANEKR
jgi:hypothetical protein